MATPYADIIVLYLVLLHIGISTIQIFFWTRRIGMKTFRLTPAYAASTRLLAANQGIYNALLALGLFWGVVHVDPHIAAREIKTFFTGFVAVAGVFGGVTVGRKIWWVQGFPGVVACGMVLWGI